MCCLAEFIVKYVLIIANIVFAVSTIIYFYFLNAIYRRHGIK